jgi:F0F1-type ATP synthase assembly protein I
MENRDQETSPLAKALREAQPFIWLGWIFACATGLGVLVGWLLDRKFGTHPLFILIFSLLGIAAGFVHFIRTVMNWKKK